MKKVCGKHWKNLKGPFFLALRLGDKKFFKLFVKSELGKRILDIYLDPTLV